MRTATARILACSFGFLVLLTFLLNVDNAANQFHSQHVRRLIVEFLDAKGIEPRSAYRVMDVCLDESYVNPAVPDCTADKLISFTNDPNPTGTQFRYKDDGPEFMQGVFWLSYLLATDSIMTFAATPDVGGGISTGTLQEDEQGYHYRLRDVGDRVWAFADKDYYDVNIATNVILLFKVVEGTLEEPLNFEINTLISVLSAVIPLRFYLGWWFRIVNYNIMTLKTEPDADFPGSVVWNRKSWLFWFIPVLNYRAVQIIDGSGNRIEPAYSKFVAYQQSGNAGGSPNWNYFDYLA